MHTRILMIFVFLFAPISTASEHWDSEENMRSAISAFQGTQRSRGNEAVVRETNKCYREAIKEQKLTKALEYCIAFDVTNIEITTSFYEAMAKKYKIPPGSSLQPEETTREAGSERIVSNLSLAGVESPKIMALFANAVDRLM
jgi:hypothetical protein